MAVIYHALIDLFCSYKYIYKMKQVKMGGLLVLMLISFSNIKAQKKADTTIALTKRFDKTLIRINKTDQILLEKMIIPAGISAGICDNLIDLAKRPNTKQTIMPAGSKLTRRRYYRYTNRQSQGGYTGS
jgi:hypothetical protein